MMALTSSQTPPSSQVGQQKDLSFEVAGQWQLMWWKFKRHRLAFASLIVLVLFYLIAAFCEFVAPTTTNKFWKDYVYAPPQRIQFFHEGSFLLHVNGFKSERDPRTFKKSWAIDKESVIPIGFFTKGEPYKLFGLIPGNRHLIGPLEAGQPFFLWGTDKNGRDVLSRNIYSSRVSLTIGLVGVTFSLLLGILFGGLSGLLGGWIDNVLQRVVEIIMSVPQLPIYMAFGALVPLNWPPVRVYFIISLIIALLSWTWLSRAVRSKLISLREEDFVLAARLDGCSSLRLIFKHMLPSFYSHIIASVTLSIPAMILSETALSFLGLGLREPVVSWGVQLREAQRVTNLANYPWILFPALSIILVVLAFNFFGDGLRDAADPYSQ
ncbi:MAG: ABC transporter permease [Trueperaceae bacterium]